jgi:hypothetical protein
MRELNAYAAYEWLRAQPLVDGAKLVRNSVSERIFRSRKSPDLDRFLHEHQALRGRTVAVTVAFNTPWVIELLLRTTRENLVNTTLIIVDNSSAPEAREEIGAICAAAGVRYLPLPPNPIRHACRSHGAALTWTYHNLIKPLRPAVFAFIDHDLFPLSPVDLASRVANQPVFGLSTPPGFGWSIWAGYCVYDFAEASKYPLDFGTDRPRGHDTGGRNWGQFYRHLDKERIRLVDPRVVEVHDPVTGRSFPVEMVDVFAHVGSVSHAGTLAQRREFFVRFVADAALKKQALELAGALPA